MAGGVGPTRGLAQPDRREQGWLSHSEHRETGRQVGAGIWEAWQWSADRCPGWWVRALKLAAG